MLEEVGLLSYADLEQPFKRLGTWLSFSNACNHNIALLAHTNTISTYLGSSKQ